MVSKTRGLNLLKTLLNIRVYGFSSAKFKVDSENPVPAIRLGRLILGKGCDIRVDANMSWTLEDALRIIPGIANLGVKVIEQPLPVDDLSGMAELAKEDKYVIMADEGFHNRASLETLIRQRACNAVNVRLAKCGGLIGSLARCRQAQRAGFSIQIGCHTGETSLLSAAQLILLFAYHNVHFIEGAFGEFLLKHDPCEPLIQFRYGGRPPIPPQGFGLGVSFDWNFVRRMALRREPIGDAPGA